MSKSELRMVAKTALDRVYALPMVQKYLQDVQDYLPFAAPFQTRRSLKHAIDEIDSTLDQLRGGTDVEWDRHTHEAMRDVQHENDDNKKSSPNAYRISVLEKQRAKIVGELAKVEAELSPQLERFGDWRGMPNADHAAMVATPEWKAHIQSLEALEKWRSAA